MFDAPDPPVQPLMQSDGFAAALRLLGRPPVTLPCGLIVLRRSLAGLPVAMLPRAAPPPDLNAQLAAAGLGRVPLILSPEVPCDLPRALRIAAPRWIGVLPLAGGARARRARMHPKWRNQWRRARDAGIEVTHATLPADLSHPLFEAEQRQRAARGYDGWPLALTCAFAAAAPDQTRLFSARRGGEVIARMLFLCHGGGATYHLGQTTETGRRYHAHNLLLALACDWLEDRGHTILDLGPLDARTPELNRFKLRSGARGRPTGGSWLRWCPI
ncbi:hypothetical protein BOO69_10155 [Sulfitobacter alexandrii]|uniref:BioF2-like acetyltransferase domain-containing protein n=1 Tax=Sulfitobacter alexandrii TaxID=1917485 RepID=A0A1J0WHD7_9RHOB|nr:GNAT family N-acetyltransferase [Sulfitobacter alexandrii]APE43735.1 hypothetical protein BOO69_10155 [Sulfitobacter alexandrii]